VSIANFDFRIKARLCVAAMKKRVQSIEKQGEKQQKQLQL